MAKKREKGGAMSNFKQALRELVNGEEPQVEEPVVPAEEPVRQSAEELQTEPEAVNEPAAETVPQPIYEEPTPEELQALYEDAAGAAVPGPDMAGDEERMNTERTEEEEQMPYEENGTYPQNYGGGDMRSRTVIADDVEIIGDIRARGDIDILGNVEGNVMSEGHVTVAGAISGSVIAASADFESGTLNGDAIQIQSHIEVKNGVEIVGEIQAASMEVNGSVQGNITVADQIVLNASAVISGDITAQYISIQKGAILNGKLSINQHQEEYAQAEPEAAPVQPEAAPQQVVQQQPTAPVQPEVPQQPEGQE